MTKTASLPRTVPSAQLPVSDVFRTFHGLVLGHKLTVRHLCSTLHVAAESLRAAYDEPGRLSLNAVMAFSELVGEDPRQLVGDLINEIWEQRKKGAPSEPPRRSRTLKARGPQLPRE